MIVAESHNIMANPMNLVSKHFQNDSCNTSKYDNSNLKNKTDTIPLATKTQLERFVDLSNNGWLRSNGKSGPFLG